MGLINSYKITRRKLGFGPVELGEFHIIIETNQGLERAYEIANCSTRIKAFFFGGVDMAAELRCSYSWDSLLYARSRVVHAAASAGIDVIDVPSIDNASVSKVPSTSTLPDISKDAAISWSTCKSS